MKHDWLDYDALKFAAIALLFTLLCAILGSSCRTSKEVTKTEIKTDSTATRQRDSLRLIIDEERESYENKITEAKKGSVKFVPTPCPPPVIIIDSSCNKDSMVSVIRRLQDYASSLKNKVTIYADGKIEAEGQLDAVLTDMKKVQDSAVAVFHRHTDSLKVSDSLRTQLTKSQTTKEKTVNRSFTWWLLVVCFGAGCIFWHNRKRLLTLIKI